VSQPQCAFPGQQTLEPKAHNHTRYESLNIEILYFTAISIREKGAEAGVALRVHGILAVVTFGYDRSQALLVPLLSENQGMQIYD
jgi:hypothetical protein